MTNIHAIQNYTNSTKLKKQIQVILDRLPKIEYHHRSNGEIDYYGASYLISKSLCLPQPMFSQATWTHFWTWFDINMPEEIVEKKHKNSRNLVCSAKHEFFLKKMDLITQ
jgi:hypothetical protein